MSKGEGMLSGTEGARTSWSEGEDGRCGGMRDRGVDAGGESKARWKHGWHRPGSCGHIERQWQRLGQRVVIGGSCMTGLGSRSCASMESARERCGRCIVTRVIKCLPRPFDHPLEKMGCDLDLGFSEFLYKKMRIQWIQCYVRDNVRSDSNNNLKSEGRGEKSCEHFEMMTGGEDDISSTKTLTTAVGADVIRLSLIIPALSLAS
jgi:hypothetical protein